MKYGLPACRPTTNPLPCKSRPSRKPDANRFFKDNRLSGATMKRPAVLRCLKKLERGDTLIVWKLDRLGGRLADLIRMLDDFKKRGVKLRFDRNSASDISA
jgi:DNA invertase Pin-like site-specific DNA recombinase